jgi:hypothetical protein
MRDLFPDAGDHQKYLAHAKQALDETGLGTSSDGEQVGSRPFGGDRWRGDSRAFGPCEKIPLNGPLQPITMSYFHRMREIFHHQNHLSC